MINKEISNINKEELFNEFLDFLNQKYNLKQDNLNELNNLIKKETKIPLSIFNEILGPLESIVKYLKEDLKLNYEEIAKIMYRNKSPIVATYKNSVNKFNKRLDTKSDYFVPISIFSNLKLSILESIVKYLKVESKLTYHNIAVLLKRDDRTIWTIYNRSLKKDA